MEKKNKYINKYIMSIYRKLKHIGGGKGIPPFQLQEDEDYADGLNHEQLMESTLYFEFNLEKDKAVQINEIIKGLYKYLKDEIILPAKFKTKSIFTRTFIFLDTILYNDGIVIIFSCMDSKCMDEEVGEVHHDHRNFLYESQLVMDGDKLTVLDKDIVDKKPCFSCYNMLICPKVWGDIEDCNDEILYFTDERHIVSVKYKSLSETEADKIGENYVELWTQCDREEGLTFVKNSGEELYDYIYMIQNDMINKDKFDILFTYLFNLMWDENKVESHDYYSLACHNTSINILHFKLKPANKLLSPDGYIMDYLSDISKKYIGDMMLGVPQEGLIDSKKIGIIPELMHTEIGKFSGDQYKIMEQQAINKALNRQISNLR